MRLYFVRHGKAEDPDFSIPDAARRLTPEGVTAMTQAAKCYRELGVEIDVLFSSPLPRALETAEIIARALGHSEAFVVQTAALAGHLNRETVRELLLPYPQASGAMFVGHEPDLVEIVSQLCQVKHAFKKGEIVCVEIAPGVGDDGRMAWSKTPSQLLGKPKNKTEPSKEKT